jgi:hypothetical protein
MAEDARMTISEAFETGNVVDLGVARRARERNAALERAYQWGRGAARLAPAAITHEWAFFLTEYGVDAEAKERFHAGFADGVPGP